MPGAFGWKFNVGKKHNKSQTSTAVKKSRKSAEKPPWNDTVNDLTRHRASPEEIERRHIMHQSKNAEIARLQLLEKRMSKGRNSVNEENATYRETNGDAPGASCITRHIDDEDDDDDVAALRLPLRYFGVPNLTVAPNYKLQSLYSQLIVTESQTTPDTFKPRTSEDLHLQWSRQKTPAAWTYHTQSTIQAMNDTDRIQEVKKLSRIKDAKSSEAQRSLVNVCKKLTFNSEDSQSSEAEVASCRTSDSGDSESVSSFTAILLDTLTKVSQKCIQLTEAMETERNEREKLQSEVKELKLLVNELTKEVIYLHGELGKQHATPAAEPSSSGKKTEQEMSSSSSSSSSSATSVIPSAKVDGINDNLNLRKTDINLACSEKRKAATQPTLKKSMSETNYPLFSKSASNISLGVKFQPEREVTKDTLSATAHDSSRNKSATKTDHSPSKGVGAVTSETEVTSQSTLSATLPSSTTTAFMLFPPVQLDVSQTTHQRTKCEVGEKTCHFCNDPQLSLLKALGRSVRSGLHDSGHQDSVGAPALCSPSTCTSDLLNEV